MERLSRRKLDSNKTSEGMARTLTLLRGEDVMRLYLLSLVLATVVLAVPPASGQGMQLRTPNPDATAADAEWQIRNEPIVAAGLTYYPTHETRMFDGQVMTQIDVYKNVPVYADMSIEPFTLVYVPLTPTRMRTYERPPDGRWVVSGRGRIDTPTVGTAGTVPSAPAIVEPPTPARSPSIVESIPGPRGTTGIWVRFEGARWDNDGAAQPYSADRFIRIGDYHGFPVYRERGNRAARIWIAAVKGGMLTPYEQR